MDYVRAAALVTRLINKNGRTVDILKLDDTPLDSNKPWKGKGTPTVAVSTTVKGVFVPAFNSENLGLDFINDELLKTASEVLLVGPNDVDFTTYHMVLDNFIQWNIEFIQTLRPADDILLYAIGVKR
jgi:hypothetical protein